MKNSFKKYWWVLFVIFLFLIFLTIWFFLISKSEDKEINTYVPISSVTTEASKTATPSSQKETIDNDEDLLKKAVSEKTGIPIGGMVFEVSENTGKHAKGLISTKGEMFGGGYWLAVKTAGKWTVVFDGQNTPGCTFVDPPEFPADMVPECFDASGNIVNRK